MEHRATRKHIFCPYRHHRPLECGQNIFFLKVVVLIIKLKDMEHWIEKGVDDSAVVAAVDMLLFLAHLR